MSAILFGSPWAALKSWAGVTPGLSRTNVGPPTGSPVTVDTTLTPPDCSAPPTVIVFPVIFTVITGRAVPCPVWAAGAVWAASAVPPGMARDRPAATRAVVMLLRIAGSPFQVLVPPAGRRMRGLASSVASARMHTPDGPARGHSYAIGLRGLTTRPRPHPPPFTMRIRPHETARPAPEPP